MASVWIGTVCLAVSNPHKHWPRSTTTVFVPLVTQVAQTPQQTRDVDPMLVHCWVDVVDGGPTVNQHWVSVSYLLGNACHARAFVELPLSTHFTELSRSEILATLYRQYCKAKKAVASHLKGRGPRVVVSTAAFHARVRGSIPGFGGLKETKMFLPHPRVKVSIVGSLRDREVACSAADRQVSNFESSVWRTVSSQSSHHPQEVLLAQFSLYVHKGGLKPDSFHLISHLKSMQLLAFDFALQNISDVCRLYSGLLCKDKR